jgi:hypothetical protein
MEGEQNMAGDSHTVLHAMLLMALRYPRVATSNLEHAKEFLSILKTKIKTKYK